MHNGKYVSTKFVINKVYRDNEYGDEVDWASCLEWVFEALNKIGSPVSYINKFADITIADYKGSLPCDLFKLTSVKDKETGTSLRRSTHTYHEDLICEDERHADCGDATYTINNYYIFTNFEEGTLRVAYKAFPTDDNGYPQIPDEDKVIEAVACYICMKIDWKLMRTGKLSERMYDRSEQKWFFYVNSAKNKLNMPDMDQMESIRNRWVRLIPNILGHEQQFKNISDREERYTHNS